MARSRLVVVTGVVLVLAAVLLSGAARMWSPKLGSLQDMGGKGGVIYGSSNSSQGHGSTKYMKSKPHKRPGYELPLGGGLPLRIMALGASTTRGDSPEEGIDNNGFRRPLREKLTAIGNAVNFVGTQRLGSMTDNDIEAYPGVATHLIHEHARQAVPRSRPNLFLVNAGSNDCFQHRDIDRFYQRYDALVQYLLAASPRATVVITTILPTWNERFAAREEVWRVNPQIRRLARLYAREGRPVVLAELQGPDGVQDQNLAADGMHPGTAGYEMMATKMFEAIVEADARGLLQSPVPVQGILDDGDAERADEEDYARRLAEKKAREKEETEAEDAEIARMREELERLRREVGERGYQVDLRPWA
ncbi:SGNH hydrolase-type esterase domain-containing protein [Xylariomycetidae sp. FL0641]|nr:SGNH hydrolase-type esterase domain-containing protein [Xylariomycetidae sp. FL0641]